VSASINRLFRMTRKSEDFEALRARWEVNSAGNTCALVTTAKGEPQQYYQAPLNPTPLKQISTNPFFRRLQHTKETLTDPMLSGGFASGARPSFAVTQFGDRNRENKLIRPSGLCVYGSSQTPSTNSKDPRFTPKLPRSNTTSNLPVPSRCHGEATVGLPASKSSTILPSLSNRERAHAQTRLQSGIKPRQTPQKVRLQPPARPAPDLPTITASLSIKKLRETTCTPVQKDLEQSVINTPLRLPKISSSHNISQHHLLHPLSPPTPSMPRIKMTAKSTGVRISGPSSSVPICQSLPPSPSPMVISPELAVRQVRE
jgi:hypothetical protein